MQGAHGRGEHARGGGEVLTPMQGHGAACAHACAHVSSHPHVCVAGWGEGGPCTRVASFRSPPPPPSHVGTRVPRQSEPLPCAGTAGVSPSVSSVQGERCGAEASRQGGEQHPGAPQRCLALSPTA